LRSRPVFLPGREREQPLPLKSSTRELEVRDALQNPNATVSFDSYKVRSRLGANRRAWVAGTRKIKFRLELLGGEHWPGTRTHSGSKASEKQRFRMSVWDLLRLWPEAPPTRRRVRFWNFYPQAAGKHRASSGRWSPRRNAQPVRSRAA